MFGWSFQGNNNHYVNYVLNACMIKNLIDTSLTIINNWCNQQISADPRFLPKWEVVGQMMKWTNIISWKTMHYLNTHAFAYRNCDIYWENTWNVLFDITSCQISILLSIWNWQINEASKNCLYNTWNPTFTPFFFYKTLMYPANVGSQLDKR